MAAAQSGRPLLSSVDTGRVRPQSELIALVCNIPISTQKAQAALHGLGFRPIRFPTLLSRSNRLEKGYRLLVALLLFATLELETLDSPCQGRLAIVITGIDINVDIHQKAHHR